MPWSTPKHKATPRRTPVHRVPLPDRQARRALPTNSKVWRAIRASVLFNEPLCRECFKHDRVTAATEVDHIDGNDAHNDRSNLQSLCKRCHSRKTAMENRGFGNRPKGDRSRR